MILKAFNQRPSARNNPNPAFGLRFRPGTFFRRNSEFPMRISAPPQSALACIKNAHALPLAAIKSLVGTLCATVPLVRVSESFLGVDDNTLMSQAMRIFLRTSGLEGEFASANSTVKDLYCLQGLKSFLEDASAMNILMASLDIPKDQTANMYAAVTNLMVLIRDHLGEKKPWEIKISMPPHVVFVRPQVFKTLTDINPSFPLKTRAERWARISMNMVFFLFGGSLAAAFTSGFVHPDPLTQVAAILTLLACVSAAFLKGKQVLSRHPHDVAKRLFEIYCKTQSDLQKAHESLAKLQARFSRAFSDYLCEQGKIHAERGFAILSKIEAALKTQDPSALTLPAFEKELNGEAQFFSYQLQGFMMVARGSADYKDDRAFKP